MRYPSIKEASKYANELLPAKSSIYTTGSSLYSSFKALVLKKEFSVPSADYRKSGVLQQTNMVWHTSPKTLHLYSFDTNTTETITNFSSDIHYVMCFDPISGIFSSRVRLCLLVVTESDVIIYALDNNSIINTDFSSRLYSPVTCVDIVNGRIYLGCQDGNIYQAIYNTIDLIKYKYMNLYTPYSIVKSFCSVFKRKSKGITAISASANHLVALGSNITVYKINGGIYKQYSLDLIEESIKVQILEDSPLFFCCIQKNGREDFFTHEKTISKDFPVGDANFDFGDDTGVGKEGRIKSII